MGAHDAHDLGRHVFRFGGEPVGSFMKPETSPLRPTMAHAVFMDLTHDNRSPVEVSEVLHIIRWLILKCQLTFYEVDYNIPRA